MIRRTAALAAAAVLLVACGTDDAGRFDAATDEVRAAVQAGDRDAALARIDELGTLGMEAHLEGDLDEAEIAELGGLLDQARLLVAAELPEEATTTTEAPPPEPPTTQAAPVADVDDDDDDDDEKKRGKGNKKDKDDDDDDD